MNYYYYQPKDIIVTGITRGTFVHLKIGNQIRVISLATVNKWIAARILVVITQDLADVFNEPA